MALFGKRGKKAQNGLGKAEDSLHVIEFSQGKPNELSFNVLGNLAAEDKSSSKWKARREARKEAKRDAREARLARKLQKKHSAAHAEIPASAAANAAQQGGARSGASLEHNAAFLGVAAQDEIRKRQKARRTHRIVSIVFIVSACLALAGAGVIFLYNQYTQLQSNQAYIQAACDELEKTDAYLVPIDQFFNEPFGDETLDRAQKLYDSIPTAKKELESARIDAERANEEVKGDSRDKEAADYTLVAVSSRYELLDAARERLALDMKAKRSIDALEQAHENVLHANAYIIEAAKVVANTTNENVEKANANLEEAKKLLEESTGALAQVEESWPAIDVSAIRDYVNKRLEQVDYALASDAAIMVLDRATAESYNSKYNEADKQAAELAKALPEDFTTCVIDLYTPEAVELAEKYNAARRMVGTADASIRKYLGIETQHGENAPFDDDSGENGDVEDVSVSDRNEQDAGQPDQSNDGEQPTQ